MSQVFCSCTYLMQGQFLLWRNWGAATWKRYSKVPGAHHSNVLLKVLSTARRCGVRKPPYCGFDVELFTVEVGNDIGLRCFWVEGVADECCDNGCFGLASDFCLFADSVEDSAIVPDLWGALLIREHFLAQSLGFVDITSMFLFFPIGIRWAFPTWCSNWLTIFKLNIWKERVLSARKANIEHR